jgi:hypothetical protein
VTEAGDDRRDDGDGGHGPTPFARQGVLGHGHHRRAPFIVVVVVAAATAAVVRAVT